MKVFVGIVVKTERNRSYFTVHSVDRSYLDGFTFLFFYVIVSLEKRRIKESLYVYYDREK